MSKKINNRWRLPTVKELITLIDYSKYAPASTDPEMKINAYWSSTPMASTTRFAWAVDFYGGNTYSYRKTYPFTVRCVKNTENGLEWSKTAEKKMTWGEAIVYAKNMNK